MLGRVIHRSVTAYQYYHVFIPCSGLGDSRVKFVSTWARGTGGGSWDRAADLSNPDGC